MLSFKPTFSLSTFTFIKRLFRFLFTFCHKGGVICIYEVVDISPSNLDSSLCFFQPIKDLILRPEIIKLLEENIGRTVDDINQNKILYDPPPKIMEIKTKVSKWGLIKLKSFCTAKETISKVKRQPSEWEKIIANEATDKGLISKLYKQLIQLNTRKTTQSKSGEKT